MKLVSAEVIRNRIACDEIDEINTSINSVLDETTEYLLKALRYGSFTRGTFVDTFQCYHQLNDSLGGGQNKLLLSHGFVVGEPVVTASGKVQSLASGTDVTAYGLVDKDAGVITLVDLSLTNQYVRVAYTAGFEVNESDATLYKAEQVPEWLKQLAISAGIRLLYKARPDLRKFVEGQVIEEENTSVIDGRISEYMRYEPNAVIPM